MTHATLATLAALATLGAAAGEALADPDDLAATRSQIGWGTTTNPERYGVWSEGGWSGGDHRAEVDATVEATVLPRASVFATAQYGGEFTNARPAIGGAVQLLDPRTSTTGARLTLAYKPEGFTEPEGEIESVLVLSQRIGRDALRARFAYGQDPEGRESDGEAGASYVHRLAANLTLGATSRYRRAIKVKTTLEPSWDLLTGCSGGYLRGRARVEALLGVGAIAYAGAPAQVGALALVSFGIEL